MAAGVAAGRRWGDRAQRFARSLLKGVLFGLVPPVVFVNIARLEFDADIGVGIALGWVALSLSGLLAYLTARRMGLPAPQAGVITNAGLQGNTGYLGLPLVVALLGGEHLGEAIAFDALAQGPVLFLGVFGVGAALGTKAGEGVRQRARAFLTRNPVIWAVVLGLLAPASLAPDAAYDVSRGIIFALLPICFFAVGIVLSGEHVETRFDRRIAAAVAFRMAVAPVLLLALAAPLIDLPDAYLLLAATPAGINGIIVAHQYGLDVDLAASTIAWTTGVFLVVASLAVGLAGCGDDRSGDLARALDRQITAYMNDSVTVPGSALEGTGIDRESARAIADARTDVEVECEEDACTSRATRTALGATTVVEGEIEVRWDGGCYTARTVRVRSEHLDVPADPRNVLKGCL